MNEFSQTAYREYIQIFWTASGGDEKLLNHLERKGPAQVLPSVFDVTSFATASVGSALLAAAELKMLRSESAEFPSVEISSLEACAAFKSDSLFQPIGWHLPPVWDPFAGDYACKDGWIRLHTNYTYHRDAVFKVLGVASTREELAQKVANFEVNLLETEVVQAGGCAAVMRTKKEWDQHPHGRFATQEKMISFLPAHPAQAAFTGISKYAFALEGIRVLDLTLVIAGPTCTQFLSSQGADVLRIDPPGFEEVAAILPLTTTGKRRAFLDITSGPGKQQFEKLLREAHVLVHGLRPSSLKTLS